MICVFFVTMIFVFIVRSELLLSCFFCKLHAMKGVTVGDVSVVRCGGNIVLVVSFCCGEVMLCG